MNDDSLSPIDLSADAALELEELDQGRRTDAPALGALFDFLRTPVSTQKFEGNSGLSMLADVRSYTVLRDSIGVSRAKVGKLSDFKAHVEAYLEELESGVRAKKRAKVQEAKRFCLSLNENLLSKRMADIYQRRERADSRYMDYDAISRF